MADLGLDHPVDYSQDGWVDQVRALTGGKGVDLAVGRLTVLIDRTFPLSEAAAAHAHLEGRQAVGRVLLTP